MKGRSKILWPYALGVALGLVAGVFYLGVPTADATGDDAVVFTIDPSQEFSQSDIDALVQLLSDNPGRDVILQPAKGYKPPSGEERRLRDRMRAAKEDAELAEHLEQGYADGTYVTGAAERAGCAGTRAELVSGPGRHLLCEGQVVAASGRVPFLRATTPGQVESVLEEHVYDLLEGVSPEEEARGYHSYFSNPAALQSLTLGEGGALTLDFNLAIRDQLSGLHPGLATHNLLQQIFRTVFQFRDVSSVEITMGGSCEAFGNLIGGPCQKIDRDLWEQMLSENGESLTYFNLKGGN